jgi:hypothetical protein
MTSIIVKEDGTNRPVGTIDIGNDTIKVSVTDPDLASYLAKIKNDGVVVRLADSGKSTATSIVDGADMTDITDPKFPDILIDALYDQGYIAEKVSA